MKHLYLALAALLAVCPAALGVTASSDSTWRGIRDYREEQGFYHKAYRELNDPRFMWSDQDRKIDFGIGCTANVLTFLGIGGQSQDFDFTPGSIFVPSTNDCMYDMSIGGTEVHFKARTYLPNNHKMGAYIKIGAGRDNAISLNQAYISYDNFSIGLIPTFFMDLEVGVMTSGLGFNSQVDKSHPLIGYTFHPTKRLSIAAALEWPELDLDHYAPATGVATAYQHVPDVAAHVKYRGDKGHVQFGAVARWLTYWAYEYPAVSMASGVNRSEPGFGLSFSGNYKPFEKLKLSWELTTGYGYSGYLNNLSGLHLDMGRKVMDDGGFARMATIPVTSDQIAAQYDFSDKFSSSLVTGYTWCGRREGVNNFDSIHGCFSLIGNFFWHINDYSYLGAEYLYGYRTVYAPEGAPSFGQAHRLAVVMAYFF